MALSDQYKVPLSIKRTFQSNIFPSQADGVLSLGSKSFFLQTDREPLSAEGVPS